MAWQNLQQPFVAVSAGSPNPVAAAVLGLIPGVGAMYNGQFFKGLIHVVIFAFLISLAGHFPIFGIFIGAWVLYQSFEAYHTAVARRDGQPLPDPLGLNEVGTWLNMGGSGMPRGPQAGQAPMPGAPGAMPGGAPGAGVYAPPAATGPYADPYHAPYVGGYPPGDPGLPPVPPLSWRRKEPIGAIFLVGFGLILLLNQLGVVTANILGFLWPLVFIGFGVWLIVRRMGDTKGGPQ
ncbi:MAG TPA: DUF5668 domain-containing protein [Terracidiphilus sp.]|nr:DUF5668 domain-containing protein [Terracidiphilus sp.]